MKLKDQIDELIDFVNDNIQNINCGGCIHFAYYLSKRLKALKIDHKILYLSNWNSVALSKKAFESVTHVMVNILNIGFVDGKIITDYFEEEYFRNDKTSVKKLEYFRSSNHRWNPEYNTNQNEKLEEAVNKIING